MPDVTGWGIKEKQIGIIKRGIVTNPLNGIKLISYITQFNIIWNTDNEILKLKQIINLIHMNSPD